MKIDLKKGGLVCSEMVLTVGGVDGTICFIHNQWYLVLVIVPGGKTYSFIRPGLSRRAAYGIVTACFLNYF